MIDAAGFEMVEVLESRCLRRRYGIEITSPREKLPYGPIMGSQFCIRLATATNDG